MKVVMILGILGVCRREKICQLTLDSIKDLDTSLMVKITDTKTKIPQSFTIVEKAYLDFYRKYMALLKIHGNWKSPRNPVGINTIEKIPAAVAKYLKLPNWALYTIHCFGRSSVSLLADAGANLTTIKRHGEWKSSTVAEGYIEHSLKTKNSTARKLLGENNNSRYDCNVTRIDMVFVWEEYGWIVSSL